MFLLPAQDKVILPVHVFGMDLSLNSLPDDMVNAGRIMRKYSCETAQ